MNLLSKNIKSRMKDLGLTQNELAELAEISQVTVHKLVSGKINKTARIIELAKALKCDPDWLLNGTEPRYSEANTITPLNKLTGLYPVLDWVQAGNFSAINEVHRADADHYPCPVKCSDRTFLLKVRGQSMAGTFNEGELIFVDPEVEALNGKYVVARLDDENEATLKQLIIEGGHKFLKATNPDWPNKILPINGNCTIVGVVIFAGRLF